jgi:hypothetical protein
MQCPICSSAGQSSKVYPGATFVTAMAWQPYYDEAGKYHDHDPNGNTTHYRCSLGHEFEVTAYQQCWCGHGRPSKVQIKDSDGKWGETKPYQDQDTPS